MSNEDRKSSADSLIAATESRAQFSGHGGGRAKGARGYLSDTDDSHDFLATTGKAHIFNPQDGGLGDIVLGAAWKNLQAKDDRGFFQKLLGPKRPQGVDLDIGCLYQLKNGKRGALQAFGDMYGAYDQEPYIHLSGDDRTGDYHDDIDGKDEIITINGAHWDEIERMVVYLYIYDGAAHWAEIQPQIHVEVPNEKPVVINLHTYKSELCLCAVARLENVRKGIKMTNITEYYPSHPSMDRAFGFGLNWEDGAKD